MVKVPRFYGIILKRSSKTRACEDRWDSFLATLQLDMRNDRLNHDRNVHLMSFSAGMSMEDALADVKRLEKDGLVQGVDFCLTSKLGKSVSKLPDWLVLDASNGTVGLVQSGGVQRFLRKMRSALRPGRAQSSV